MKTYDIEGKKIAQFEGNWHNIANQARNLNAKIASSKDIISFRNELPFEHDLWQYGGWTREQPIYFKNSQGILVMNSLLLEPELAKQAVKANREGNYLTLSKEQYNKLLSIAEKEDKAKKDKRTALILPSRETFEISPTKNSGFFEKLVGKEAEKYFKRLHEKGINSITFYTISPDFVDKQSNPVTTELWFWYLDDGSVLLGGDGYLGGDGGWACGVLNETGEASSRAKLHYSNKDIEKYSKILKEVRQGNMPASKLEEALQFLEKLKQ